MFEIKDVKNISLQYSKDSVSILFSMSALYTHLVRDHKAVSFVLAQKAPYKLSNCLPWYDKIKTNQSIKYEQLINFDSYDELEVVEYLYTFFIENDFKINKKIATSLYAALDIATQHFRVSGKVTSKHYKMAANLLELGSSTCRDELFMSDSLALSRAYGSALQNMELLHNARVAYIYFNNLEHFGISSEDVGVIAQRVLNVVHVEFCVAGYERNGKSYFTCRDIVGTPYACKEIYSNNEDELRNTIVDSYLDKGNIIETK